MKCVRTCLEEGKKVNTESWLYDEDKWLSGFAGGIVPAKGDKYRSKHIQVKKVEAEKAVEALNKPSLLGIFRLELASPKTVKRFKRVNTPEEVENNGQLLLFEVKLAEKRKLGDPRISLLHRHDALQDKLYPQI
ncbi:hypothetical protein CW712_05505 [Candidatus Bathyarchaeota archaeon]|nr:MAG: hypothetical protein CW712_05505 [Candidatus Bathyarchaeota archaeon]